MIKILTKLVLLEMEFMNYILAKGRLKLDGHHFSRIFEFLRAITSGISSRISEDNLRKIRLRVFSRILAKISLGIHTRFLGFISSNTLSTLFQFPQF